MRFCRLVTPRPSPRARAVTGLALAVGLAMLDALGLARAGAQLAPSRLYYGVNGRIEVSVSIPGAPPAPPASPNGPSADPSRSGEPAGPAPEAEVVLLRPATGEAVASASVLAGVVDFAGLFPRLWKAEKPELLYAQLRLGRRALGPPLVLQPMVSPERAAPTDPRGLNVRFAPAGPAYFSGLRVYVDQRVLLETSEGDIEIALRPDAAPNSAWNFRHLVEGGFYTQIAFHRVVSGPTPAEGFVIQAGDPVGSGVGGPGYSIDLENSPLRHDFGVVSMARLAQPDTGGSQFFICLSRERAASLDGSYSSFGQVVRGGEVVRAIARTPVDASDRPSRPPVIRKARLIPAPPFGEGPKPVSEQVEGGR